MINMVINKLFFDLLKTYKSKYPSLFRAYLFIRKLSYSLRAHILSIWFKLSPIRFTPDINSQIIVSLTTFPERINNLWITIESLKRQDLSPRKIVLVLAEEEFPGKILPKSVEKQIKLGIEVLWVNKNLRSYKKLIPTKVKYPNSVIVTFDDDIIYEKWRLRKLVEASVDNPNSIIGHRGWEILKSSNIILPYNSWNKADRNTIGISCFLTGVGGILYPSGLLNEKILLDMDLAFQLCPKADDIWFWCVAVKSNVPRKCLGNFSTLPVNQLKRTTSLSESNVGLAENDKQLINVINHFSLKF